MIASLTGTNGGIGVDARKYEPTGESKWTGHVADSGKCAERLLPRRALVHQVSVEFTEARLHERAVSHARNEPTSANFHPTSAVRNFKRRAVSTALRRLSDHRLARAVPHPRRSERHERESHGCILRGYVTRGRNILLFGTS